MPDLIRVSRINATHDRIDTEAGIAQELCDHLAFFAKNYQWHPKYKARMWDGRIRLFSPYKPNLYAGLREELKDFARKREYEIEFDYEAGDLEISRLEAEDFVKTLNLPKEMNGMKFEVREEQYKAFLQAVRKGRLTLLSPTASGKSLIIYLLTRFYGKKTLIIVPTLGLVDQMYEDFEEYGYNSAKHIHRIYGGQPKETNHPVTVSTWQSLKDMPASYLSRYHVVIGDEVHGFSAAELKGVMERCVSAYNRFGTTGTLDGIVGNEMTITGLFGPIFKVISTAELMAEGKLAELYPKCIILKHPDEVRKKIAKSDYQTEIAYITSCPERNNYIKNLALSIEGNTLITFRFIAHGEELQRIIEAEATCPVLYVAGSVPKEDRARIRKFVNEQERSITIASIQTFATGTNIPNIHNLITTHPVKSVVTILQTIGRVLRRSATKTRAKFYDIVDDLSWKSKKNHTLNQFLERYKIYIKEKFKPKIYEVTLNYG